MSESIGMGARMPQRSAIFREAQERLREYIRRGGLSAGDRLPGEHDLASALGVSRASLREATRSLQSLGVIEARPGRGLYVAEFSMMPVLDQLPYALSGPENDLRSVVVAREAMEVGLMGAVSRTATSDDLDKCAELAHRMAVLEAANESTTKLDRAFHLQLYASLHNPIVDRLIETFWELYTRMEAELGEPRVRDKASVHLATVNALASGDRVASMRMMEEHFVDIRARAFGQSD